MVEFSNILYFSNLFLKTPTIHGRMDGRSCSCMLYNENHLRLEHDWEDSYMMYTLDHYCCFNWYHWNFFSIGINMYIFLYTHICFVLYMYGKIRYQSKLILLECKHTYIQTYMSIQEMSRLIPIERIQWYQKKQQ